MPFQPMQKPEYPPRRWGLFGRPGAGKSTFATKMKGPLLILNSDQRFAEVLPLAGAREVFQLSDNPSDNTDPDAIATILAREMPGSGVQTIVLDSITAVIQPVIAQAILDKEQGRVKSLAGAWKVKAMTLRILQDALTAPGCDTLWIWHERAVRDARGKAGVTQSLPTTERARLLRSLNMVLEIFTDGDRRGVNIAWCRRGRSDVPTLWDPPGNMWEGMPERIEAAAYDGLTGAERAEIEDPPHVFNDPSHAIGWAASTGAFGDPDGKGAIPHSRNAYEKLRREEKPANAQEMARLWVDDVRRRLAELEGQTGG